ncbi:unnamed protein product [Heterobilharzia americana]|nr:unnamed protein product [Heterobilharzia americana]
MQHMLKRMKCNMNKYTLFHFQIYGYYFTNFIILLSKIKYSLRILQEHQMHMILAILKFVN